MQDDSGDIQRVASFVMGPLWTRMGRRPRRSMASLRKQDVPLSAGVYALYRSDRPMYVGKAKSLRSRVWSNHGGRGMSMSNSAMRRNIAERLGIATAADIKAGRHRVSSDEAARVRAWLDRCEVAWIECASEAAAEKLENQMKDERLPPLTKQ